MIHQLNISKIDLVRPLIEERVRESGIGKRMQTDLAIATIRMHAQSGYFNVLVDNVENPTALLILVVGPITFFNEVTCSIALLHAQCGGFNIEQP